MSGRTLAAFVLGFAAGMLFLGVVLRAGGHLGMAPAQAALPAPSAPLPDFSASEPAPTPAALPELIPPARAGEGDADRTAPPKPLAGLAMPLAGIDPSKLYDSFNDPRTDHKHEALDIMAPRGTPVLAAAEGNVVKLFNSKQGGLTVYQFDNSRTYCFYYAHLDRYARGLKEGTLLRQGDVLGYVGSTGDASPDAPHLHFAIFELGPEKQWWKGTAINPLPILQRSAAKAPRRSR